MKFGVSIPTCREGLNLPLPFSTIEETVQLAVDAEALGFDSVWGNDHVTAPSYVRRDYSDPPRFYEPLIVFAAAAARTSSIRFGTGVLVAPMREPVYLAKQVATLDQLSGGRLTLGLGTGAYREEFEAVRPRLKGAKRGAMLDEMVDALTLLFAERSVSYAGSYVEFDGIELYPKPVQQPLPIYFGGNSPEVLRRVAVRGQGWIAGALAPALVAEGRRHLLAFASEAGRDGELIDIAPQYVCSIAPSHDEAVRQFRASRFYIHLKTLSESTLRGQDMDRLEQNNLVGTPAELQERIGSLKDYGATSLGATVFAADTPERMRDDMQLFAEEVIPHFR
jgi:probable F420-dependent oxidoreductase